MTDYLVSIIVPVYNVEEYVEQCVRSILSQSYENCELIIVDDGSTDNSLKICEEIIDEFCDKGLYDRYRIKIVKKENNGVSSARNAGLRVAEGFFVAFVDSDDWVDRGYIEDMLKMYDGKSEIIISGIAFHEEDKEVDIKKIPNDKYFEFNETSVDDIVMLESLYVFNGVHRKLFINRIIKEKHITFDERYEYGEDLMFVFSYLRYVSMIIQVDKVGYQYRCGRHDSLTSLASKYRFEDEYFQWRTKRDLYIQKRVWAASLKKLLYLQLWGAIDNGIMFSIKSDSRCLCMTNINRILSLNEIDSLKMYKDIIPSTWIRWSVLHRIAWPFYLYSVFVNK